MTTISELREALQSVPVALLDEDDQRVMTETLVSLDALERFDVVPTVVAFVGSSGSGKSALVNAALAAEISPSGPIRPTTDVVTMIGSSGPVSLPSASEYLHLSSVRTGLLVIDTPPWEHDPRAVAAAVGVADLVVVVVTPSRYADASVAELVAAIPSGQPSAVVLNRIDVAEDDRTELLASFADRFNTSVVLIDEGESMDRAVNELLDALNINSVEYQRSAILRSAAAAGAGYLAKRVVETVDLLARFERTLQTATVPSIGVATLPILDTWDATRSAIVKRSVGAERSIDESMMASGGPLATNLLETLPPIEPEDISSALETWKDDTVDVFQAEARVRWRKRAAADMLDRFAWRVAINSDVQSPPRFRRVMGDRLDRCSSGARDAIDQLLNEPLDRRLDAWRQAGADIGSYAPGILLSLSESFDPDGAAHG
ncbi:MAG: hypothetical protein ACR2NG_00820 [Acidimicrobiia bacterium]